MPANRNALIRYKTIDRCLQNRFRKWTLEDLIDACSEALYEYEGIDKGVSKRTIQADIQMMRSDKLGYNAPIIVLERKFYTYEDPDFSITNIPLSENDLNKLHETIEFMRQFKGFSHFKELDGMVQKLEDHIYAQKAHTNPVIDFEKNDNLKGIEYLDSIYQAILKERSLEIHYQSFRARKPSQILFYPYWLKEFRNRWFVVGLKRGGKELLNLALDRIHELKHSKEAFKANTKYDLKEYYKDVIGASVSPEAQLEETLLFIEHKHAPYVLTKPLHHSQKEVSRDGFGVTISLWVQHNFELEKEILSYGESIQVITPIRLKRRIKERLEASVDKYNTEIQAKGLAAKINQLQYKGYAVLNHVFTKREVNHIKRIIQRKFSEKGPSIKEGDLLAGIPSLKNNLFNKNLQRIIRSIDEKAVLLKTSFFEKEPQTTRDLTLHQDSILKEIGATSISFTLRIHLDETDNKNGALMLLPGSHKNMLSLSEIEFIKENSLPILCEVGTGGVHLMSPLILRASSKLQSQKKRWFIQMNFGAK
ncbi:MAG: WYL domain-containing protein [Bacteroidia bacterium]|nr:WYL domain-containing protein [Bacteroidia bacterium]